MRQFYLGLNQNGYYRVYFVDPVTGVRGPGKSTHTKNRDEALIIAGQWLKEGVPSAMAHSRAFSEGTSKAYSGDLHSFIMHLSDDDAREVLFLLSQKLNISLPENKPAELVAVKTAAPVSAAPSKKRYVVVKKKAVEEVADDSVKVVNESFVPSASDTNGKHRVFDTLFEFWDFEHSKFIERRLAHGFSISKKHTIQMQGFAKNNWLPYFGMEKCIEDLTRNELDDFFFYLRSEKGFSGETVNKNINCANRCFNWLLQKGEIKANPLDGIERYKVDINERGIPTETEVRKLLELEWSNPLAKLAFKLGAFCGLRAGEISGLRVCDIDLDADIIHVRHSWSEIDDLKCTKNTDTRDLPIDHFTAVQLMNQARMNPNFGDLSYVFWAPHNPSQPFYPGYYGDIFYQALDAIGIHEEERKERNIVFHSLRHFCCTVLKQRADTDTVMQIMGHRTSKMTEHYSDHESQEKFDNMRNIMTAAWEKYLTA